jgi:hypothetical protein
MSRTSGKNININTTTGITGTATQIAINQGMAEV